NSVETEQMNLTLKQLFLALAKQVPNPNGSQTLVDNPYQTWNQIDPTLPKTPIQVMGPPPTSGTRDAFVELAMEGGCSEFPWIKALEKSDKNRYKQICHVMREDGPFITAGEDDNLIV